MNEVTPITTGEARAIVRTWLTDNGFPTCALRAKTVSFIDLARDSRVVVTVHGWTPDPALADLERIARAHKFSVRTDAEVS